MTRVGENLQRIREQIERATDRSGRPPGSVRLVGVTKRIEAESILEAFEAGLAEIGESKVQEAETKVEALRAAPLEWHLIGHLQSNKASRAVKLFDVIQTIDSLRLAQRLDRLTERRLPVLVEVHLGGEASKSGLEEKELESVVRGVGALPNIELAGLMSVPPFAENPEHTRPYFRRLRDAADKLGLREVSMGMSHDFEVAIEEGATMVRIGAALFGART